MNHIILGIKDYMKDVSFDKKIGKLHGWKHFSWLKEGNVWHYIRQRRIAAKVKKQRAKK